MDVSGQKSAVFRGSASTRIDDKGRLKIPTLFRGLVHARSGADVFVTSVKGDSVLIYPMQVWADMEERVLKAPTQHPALVKFMDRVSYFGQPGELDPQGRVAIPPHLRQHAGITGEVRVLGRINFR